jgi:hypothetical protein
MSLQRGSYGIEFDEREGFPLQKLWWGVVLIPVAALGFIFVRGCSDETLPAAPTEDPALATRFDAPEVKADREKPSLFRHFLQRGTKKSESVSAVETDSSPRVRQHNDGWMSASSAKPPEDVKIQSPEVQRLLGLASAKEAEDDLVGARQLFRRLLVMKDAEEIRPFVERKIGMINITLLFSDRPTPEKVRHRIVSGDLIGKLSKRYGNTQEYLLKANGIDKPELLRIGREIWVMANPVFELTAFKRGGSAVLTLNGQFFKRYLIGVGKPGESPNGTYTVKGHVKRPVYRSPEYGEVPFGNPKNILGAGWIGLAATGETPDAVGFGLHGTWNESSLGRPSEEGRIRFRNADIEELYTLLPNGSLVNITE